jgi:predicted transcriptional regulator
MTKLWKHKSELAFALKQRNLAKFRLQQAEQIYRDTNKACGKAFRLERKAAEIGLREMARKLEISAAYLSDIELGRRNFPEFWNSVKVKV